MTKQQIALRPWRVKDLSGQKFGRLTVLHLAHTDHNGAHWACRCDCGREHIAGRGNLVSGRTKSCGCLDREVLVKRNTTHNLRGLT